MRVGIIADDLTGANATGVGLAKQGLFSTTILHNNNIPNSHHNMAVCIDTDSRYAVKDTAQQRIREATMKLQNWDADILCKRIDSTIRGNIGIETDTMLNMLGDNTVAVICPSYPSSGRVVIGGALLVNQVLVHETDVGKDPIRPITTSHVSSLLKKQSEHVIGQLDLEVVSQGSEIIESEIQSLINQGSRMIVCDAVSRDHISNIAEAMTKVKQFRLIPVDPGPLTNYYVKAMKRQVKRPHDQSKFIVTVGSVTSVTRNQLDYLVNEINASPIIVDPKKLVSLERTWEEEINRAIHEAAEKLLTESTVVVTTNHPDHELIDFKKESQKQGASEDVLSKRITSGLAQITKQLIDMSEGGVKGCFFSGGDVTSSFCETVEANGIELKDEVMPLVSYGHILGGEVDGLPVVTKGGMIGDKQAIAECVKYLQKINEGVFSYEY